MFGKSKDPTKDEDETLKIQDRLDEGETVVMWVRQSRVKPGGAAVLSKDMGYKLETEFTKKSKVLLGFGIFLWMVATVVTLGIFSWSLVFIILIVAMYT